MNGMIDRMRRATMLDRLLYQEAENDRSLTQEALLIVVIVSLVNGIGALLGGILRGGFGSALLAAVVAVVIGVVNYYIWSYVTYFVGTSFFGGTADVGEILRVLGYAYTPQLLGLLGFIPFVGWLFRVAAFVLSLVAAVIALREALDFDTGRAILTAAIGWVIILIINAILSLLGLGSVGLGVLPSLRR
jgi:hypothetical protein